MIPCIFFSQGNCRYGNDCRFGHNVPDSFNNYQNTGSTTSILRNPTFVTTPTIQSQMAAPGLPEQKSVDTATLVKSVVSDMDQIVKGGQWLFSCYGPFKEKPAFPGFEDQSFEELRYGYYEAEKNGTKDAYIQQAQNMFQEVLMKVRSLQNPSSEITNILINIYNTPPSMQAGVYNDNTPTDLSFKSGGINQKNTSNVFAQPQQTTSIFGNSQQPQQNIFNNAANTGFMSPNQNIFGNQQSHSQSIFNTQTQQQNTFGTNVFTQGNNNIQSNPDFSNNIPSVFSPPTSQQNTAFAPASQPLNLYTGQNSHVPTQNVNIINMQQAADTNKNPLLPTPNVMPQLNTVNSPLNLQGNNANIFNTPFSQSNQQNPIFNQATQNSVFGAPKDTPQSYSNSIFGGGSAGNSSVKSNIQQALDPGIYSKLEDLTEDEVKWFQSDDMDIMRIPEKPPTYEMCL